MNFETNLKKLENLLNKLENEQRIEHSPLCER